MSKLNGRVVLTRQDAISRLMADEKEYLEQVRRKAQEFSLALGSHLRVSEETRTNSIHVIGMIVGLIESEIMGAPF